MVVRSYMCYRAFTSEGVIIENAESFKNLYRGVVRELRDVHGHHIFFDSGFAVLEYGVLTEVYEGSECKSYWLKLREIARIHCSSCDRKTYIVTRKGF